MSKGFVSVVCYFLFILTNEILFFLLYIKLKDLLRININILVKNET